MSILIIDTETTGLDFEEDDILQLAWIIYDKKGKSLKVRNKYIYTEARILNSHFHGITNEILEDKGINLYDAMYRLIEDIKKFNVQKIVGHNLNFDLTMIRKNSYRRYIDCSYMDTIEQFCTMKYSSKRYGYGKWLKLSVLYERLFKDKPSNLHNAINDVKACAKCYFKMVGVDRDDSDDDFEV